MIVANGFKMDEILEQYLDQSSTKIRLQILQDMRKKNQWLPLDIARDLLCLSLSDEEKMSIIRTISHKNSLAFEDFLTGHINEWNQNVSSAALWEWALRSPCTLWHRTIPLSFDPHLSQRVSYTLLDLAWFGGGTKIVENFIAWDNLEDMSPAFLCLLFFRALQWDVESEKFKTIASQTVKKSFHLQTAPEKTLPYSLAYLYRYDFEKAKRFTVDHKLSGIWTQFHGPASDEIASAARINTLQAMVGSKLSKTKKSQLIKIWPMIWERYQLKAEHLSWIFQEVESGRLDHIKDISWEFFTGIPSNTLLDTLKISKNTQHFLAALSTIGNLIHVDSRDSVLHLIREHAIKASDPASFIKSLPPKFATVLNSDPQGQSSFDRVLNEQQRVLANPDSTLFNDLMKHGLDETQPISDRERFFDIAYRGIHHKIKSSKADGYWQLLTDAWIKPDLVKLDSLSQEARCAPRIFQLCFIDTLARYEGVDTAALKLLDFIRSQEEDILRGTIYALAGIDTNRSKQELVAFLTRPNIPFYLKMEITQILQESDLKLLQSELRSAINDIKMDHPEESSNLELREAISSLLVVQKPEELSIDNSKSLGETPTTSHLDKLLHDKISDYHQLSSEAKRALRTAQFFHLQVEHSGNLSTIDLSPAIDMQYKALELSFREKFEQATGELIRQGVLQRKLDIIGYARPIPHSMDDFERYIEGLDIIRSIPFFSKFKLRKMLRAICQFRPGRRFTLDGLKAFALFFLCFSRKECRYGLGNLLPLPSLTDAELCEFCKSLHVFQDFRNRAAHEGFHPDASNNLDGIWKGTVSIVEGMIRVQKILEDSNLNITRKTG